MMSKQLLCNKPHMQSTSMHCNRRLLLDPPSTYPRWQQQPRLQGAFSLKRKGPLKGDSRETRVVKATILGPVTYNRRKRIFERDFQIFKISEKKLALGTRLGNKRFKIWSYFIWTRMLLWIRRSNKKLSKWWIAEV